MVKNLSSIWHGLTLSCNLSCNLSFMQRGLGRAQIFSQILLDKMIYLLFLYFYVVIFYNIRVEYLPKYMKSTMTKIFEETIMNIESSPVKCKVKK